MVGQHDTPGTEADVMSKRSHVGDQYDRGRGRYGRIVVVLGVPHPAVTQLLGQLSQGHAGRQAVGYGLARAHRGQVEDG